VLRCSWNETREDSGRMEIGGVYKGDVGVVIEARRGCGETYRS
jgi:hypothetical protein